MKDLKTIASYICCRYFREYGEKIDEMKLHKLMYFAQRESLIQTDTPLFSGEFQGWRFGPVLPELRVMYQKDDFADVTDEALGTDKSILDVVFSEYAGKDSFSLSRLTHGELSWTRSRKVIPPAANSFNTMPLDDIRLDADRMKKLRAILDNL